MRTLLVIFLTSFVFNNGTIKMVSSQKKDFNFFTTDNIENLYFISGNTIIKEWTNGKIKNKYSNKIYGDITFVDTHNPLQILIYYPDLTKVVFVDNTLSVQNTIALEQYELEQVSLACSSVNNSFWVYDQASLQLIRFNQQMKRIQETGNIVQLLGVEIQPNFVDEFNNKVYLNDPNIGILVFDIFGTYLKTIPLLGLSFFQLEENNIFYLKNGSIFSFNLTNLKSMKLPLPFQNIEQFRVENNLIFTCQNGMFSTFKIEP